MEKIKNTMKAAGELIESLETEQLETFSLLIAINKIVHFECWEEYLIRKYLTRLSPKETSNFYAKIEEMCEELKKML
jgi:hypothetical protein